MNKLQILATACALLLAACGTATTVVPPTQVPKPTAVPPTALPAPTLVQPTVPPPTVIPAATAQAPAPTSLPAATAKAAAPAEANSLDAVINRMNTLNTGYRVSMTMNMAGMPGLGEAQIMSVLGEGQGQSARIKMSGMAFTLMGAASGVEMLNVDRKTFIKGPVAFLGAPEAKWYEMPSGQSVGDNPVKSFFGSESNFDTNSFKKVGSEKFEGLNCDVYEGDREAMKKALENAQAASGNRVSAAGPTVQDGVMKLWACEDGYVHRMSMDVKMNAGAQVINLLMNMRTYDFGAKIDPVTAPPDAQPAK